MVTSLRAALDRISFAAMGAGPTSPLAFELALPRSAADDFTAYTERIGGVPRRRRRLDGRVRPRRLDRGERGTREKFGDWQVMLDRFAAVAGR